MIIIVSKSQGPLLDQGLMDVLPLLFSFPYYTHLMFWGLFKFRELKVLSLGLYNEVPSIYVLWYW